MPQTDNPGSGGGGAGPSPDFQGAFVSLSAPFPVPTNVATAVQFGAVQYDIGGWFNLAAPTRLTVPAGVQRVRVIASSICDLDATGMRQIVIVKNGATLPGGSGIVTAVANGRTTTDINTFSAILSVSPGDYFEFQSFQVATGGPTLNLSSACFSIEKIAA